MRLTLLTIGLAVVLVTAVSPPAAAQPPQSRGWVEVNAGVQAPSRTVATQAGFVVYDEPASINGRATVGVGPTVDVGVGSRIRGHFAAAVSLSEFTRSTTATITASIPSPIFYNTLTSSTLSATGLRHAELGIHPRLLYLVDVGERAELALGGGPSFFRVTHRIPSATVTPGTAVAVASSFEERANGVGFNAGARLTYAVAAHLGIGFYGGYAGASVDLPHLAGLHVGGVQVGGGLRVRF